MTQLDRIISLLDKAFINLCNVYKNQGNNNEGKIVVPYYCDGQNNTQNLRLSEQEMRLFFIEQLLNDNSDELIGCSFCIEVPTKRRYTLGAIKKEIDSINKDTTKSKEEKETDIKKLKNDKYGIDETNGRSAEIDLVIFKDKDTNKENIRLCLIEFKAANPDPYDCGKDFAKMKYEEDGDYRLFIDVFETTSDGTLNNLKEKLSNNTYWNLDKRTTFIGYSITHKPKGSQAITCFKFIMEVKDGKLVKNEFII